MCAAISKTSPPRRHCEHGLRARLRCGPMHRSCVPCAVQRPAVRCLPTRARRLRTRRPNPRHGVPPCAWPRFSTSSASRRCAAIWISRHSRRSRAPTPSGSRWLTISRASRDRSPVQPRVRRRISSAAPAAAIARPASSPAACDLPARAVLHAALKRDRLRPRRPTRLQQTVDQFLVGRRQVPILVQIADHQVCRQPHLRRQAHRAKLPVQMVGQGAGLR